MSLMKGGHVTLKREGSNLAPEYGNMGNGPSGGTLPKKESLVSDSEQVEWARKTAAELIVRVHALKEEYPDADKDRKREIKAEMRQLSARRDAALSILRGA